MTSRKRPPLPLDGAVLERLALRYVERFATTRAKLAAYLARKIRERGWAGDRPADPEGVAERMAVLGYVDDRLFAELKARAMGRRGLGARRVEEALRHAGVGSEDAAPASEAAREGQAESALAFARRKRIGPFALEEADHPQREKQLAAMLRAGHPLDLARRITRMAPGDDVETLVSGWD
ncbi:regulatory protein RecX [Sphingomonas sp. MMS12-HWE2-04]|uniref:regulatory protein RecX n=1 Tax=Sphingomonas sp. MMS12-HWE2-04 TaxID=3234199 RepID=UPI00384E2B48